MNEYQIAVATLVTSPLFFFCWYKFTYRWEMFDGGLGYAWLWRRFRTDVWVSLPGWRGDIARITYVRARVRRYAKMEGANGNVHVRGIDERFRSIQKRKAYDAYEHAFLPPKWELWSMMVASLVWPVTLVLMLILFVIMVIIQFFYLR